jgi:hypothetical protein
MLAVIAEFERTTTIDRSWAAWNESLGVPARQRFLPGGVPAGPAC